MQNKKEKDHKVKNTNKSFFKTLNKNKELLFLTLPGTVWFLIFAYLPMFGVLIAFKNWRVHGGFLESLIKSDWVWFDNFKFLL